MLRTRTHGPRGLARKLESTEGEDCSEGAYEARLGRDTASRKQARLCRGAVAARQGGGLGPEAWAGAGDPR
jgi:hypothetical protein